MYVPILLLLAPLATADCHSAAPVQVASLDAQASLQDQISAAEPGARIELTAGEFKGALVLDRPVTLVGAGWDSTTLTTEPPPEGELPVPTIRIETEGRVELIGLRIGAGLPAGDPNQIRGVTLVQVERADLRVQDCALVGPAGTGLAVEGGAALELEGSLVAAVHGTGVKIGSDARSARLSNSVLRSCYHRCVTIRIDEATVTNCEISGSAWYGIRYDNVSPRIAGNVIYGNARSGIYASGQTAAQVDGNLFWRNEMSGMSTWFANRDTVSNNVFLSDQRESMAAISGSQPTVRGNVFIGSPVAVVCGTTPDAEGDALAIGNPALEQNSLVGEGAALQKQGESFAEFEGIVRQPGGVQLVMPFRSQMIQINTERLATLVSGEPFGELLPEELALVPLADTRHFNQWNLEGRERDPVEASFDRNAFQERWIAASKQIQSEVEAARQITDEPARIDAIAKMARRIASDEAAEQATGLAGFSQLYEVRFEREPHRDRILELMGSEDPLVRALAPTALRVVGVDPADLPLFIALARDPHPDVRASAVRDLAFAAELDFTGEVGEVFLERLEAASSGDRREILRVLWGGRFSPELEAAVIELSRLPSQSGGYDAVYFALSPQANKSRASVERLIEVLVDPNSTDLNGRAAWGLLQGVSENDASLVSQAALLLVRARQGGRLPDQGVQLLEQYAGLEDVAGIEELLTLPGLEQRLADRLRAVVHKAKESSPVR